MFVTESGEVEESVLEELYAIIRETIPVEEIQQIVYAFGETARLCKEAGVDGIVLLGIDGEREVHVLPCQVRGERASPVGVRLVDALVVVVKVAVAVAVDNDG